MMIDVACATNVHTDYTPETLFFPCGVAFSVFLKNSSEISFVLFSGPAPAVKELKERVINPASRATGWVGAVV